MSESRLRWGILGCARITARGLIPGIQQSRTGSLVGLASRDLAKARDWAKRYEVPRAFGGYAELIEHPEIDVVYVPLPNELHKPWVIAAADAGKHILCDKPLALDSREAEEIVEHCRSRGVLLMEGFMWRHQDRMIELKRQIVAGELGELRLIRSSFSFPIDLGDWRLDPERGGGSLWDVGCYGVNASRWLAGGEPETVRSFARFGSTGVDMTLSALLQFPGDVLASIDCSFEQPFRCSLEVVGSKGRVCAPLAFLPPETPVLDRSDDEQAASVVTTFRQPNQYASMVETFNASIRAGALIAPAEDGLANMKVLDAILADCS